MMRTSMLCMVALVAGCPGGATAPDAGPCAIEVAWGTGGASGFEAFADGDDAELTLGFQGFRYITSTMRVGGSDAELATFWFDIDVDGQEPYVSSAGTRPLDEGYADGVLVFFNDIPIPQLLGRAARVTANATADDCAGTHTAEVTVVDEEDCIEQPDGGLACDTQDAGP